MYPKVNVRLNIGENVISLKYARSPNMLAIKNSTKFELIVPHSEVHDQFLINFHYQTLQQIVESPR